MISRMKIRWLQIVIGGVVVCLLLTILAKNPIPFMTLVVGGGVLYLRLEGERVSRYLWFLMGLFAGASFSVLAMVALIVSR